MFIITKTFAVAALAAVALWGAIPMGLAFKLNPALICLAAAVGNIGGILAAGSLSNNLGNWVFKRYLNDASAIDNQPAYKIWIRYGVTGLGLLAPLVTGAPLGTVLGLIFGAPVHRLLFWMCLGGIIWSLILTISFSCGLAGLHMLLKW